MMRATDPLVAAAKVRASQMYRITEKLIMLNVELFAGAEVPAGAEIPAGAELPVGVGLFEIVF